MPAATARQFAHDLKTGEFDADTVAKAENYGQTIRSRLEQFSESQLRKYEARGRAFTGLEPAQSMSQLKGFAIGFVVVGVTVTVGLNIMGSVKSNINDTTAETGAQDAIDGMTELSGFLPIIGLVVAAAVVIGLVSRGFGGGSGSRGRA